MIKGGCYDTAKRIGNKGQVKTTIGGVSKKFKRMAEVYRIFSKDWEHMLDYSDDAMIEMYNSESYGTPVSRTNGFYVGKQWLNVNVQMWKEDISKGYLQKCELYDDPKFPHWWLDNVLD